MVVGEITTLHLSRCKHIYSLPRCDEGYDYHLLWFLVVYPLPPSDGRQYAIGVNSVLSLPVIVTPLQRSR